MTDFPRSVAEIIGKKLLSGEISQNDVERFEKFYEEKIMPLYQHPVIYNNAYPTWLMEDGANTSQVEDLLIQFSVFSNHFLPIQCMHMVHARSVEAEREARKVLGSEIGVSFDTKGEDIEGQIFRHKWAHINWLRETTAPLGLTPPKIPYALGDWRLGSKATHTFLKLLGKSYKRGAGGSFAIESWAGFGIGTSLEHKNFWKQLLIGLALYNKRERTPAGLKEINLKFFEEHFKIERNHVESVENELALIYFLPDFDEKKWLSGARQALRAIHIFWEGLNERRKELA